MKLNTLIFLILLLHFNISFSKKLIVGKEEFFQDIQTAANDAIAGDTIIVKAGVYNGGMHITNLRGNEENRIFIISEIEHQAIIQGGTNAIQFSDPSFLSIEGLVFEGQTGNGLNIDDGGVYSSPANNVLIRKCIFRDMNASGNNDLLKLSGLDDFIIADCIFENGANGGSGIDMVGCHNGKISNNSFKNMGSNAIQAKGGTRFIIIYANFFESCGQRTLNLGGSTGLEYFRPIDAKFEAADLKVYCNVFVGSVSPVNYVGSVRVEVVNNTIFKPEKWVLRILQETVDESRFLKCGDNVFANNIIYLGNLSTETNIGPNTSPETFTFSNNFWFNYQNENWIGPKLPTIDVNQRINSDPLFINLENFDFRLKEESNARNFINFTAEPFKDYLGHLFLPIRSAGAYEYTDPSYIDESKIDCFVSPNPASDYIEINLSTTNPRVNPWVDYSIGSNIKIYNTYGECVLNVETKNFSSLQRIDISHLPVGLYFIQIGNVTEKFVVVK